MPTGVAIVGSGVFVREAHLPSVQATPSLSLKALYSRSLKSVQALASAAPGVDLYSDDAGDGKTYSDLLARPDVEGVIIALPITKQAAYVKAALSAGKHVFSEKPIAHDVAEARELLDWYHNNVDKTKTTWSVAENFRFFESYQYGAEQVKQLGKIVGFNVKMQMLMEEGSKYQETSWRKQPTHQGGFLLDGGVHIVAATRLLLSASPASVSAFTAQHQPHLPPVDTVDAVWRLGDGTSGTYSNSFAAPVGSIECRVLCKGGSVTAGFDGVAPGPAFIKVQRAGSEEEEKKVFPEKGFGVVPEVAAWSYALEHRVPDARQSPEEALKDLEIVEAMLKSGQQGGAPVTLRP